MSFESRERTQDIIRNRCFPSSLGSPNRRLPGSSGGLHSAVRAGGCTTPTGFAARAGAQANHAPTFNTDHSLGAGHIFATPSLRSPGQSGMSVHGSVERERRLPGHTPEARMPERLSLSR